MLMGTAKNNPQMEEECRVSGKRLLKHVHVRNQCNHRNQLQGDKTPHRVLPDRHVAVLKTLFDYGDYRFISVIRLITRVLRRNGNIPTICVLYFTCHFQLAEQAARGVIILVKRLCHLSWSHALGKLFAEQVQDVLAFFRASRPPRHFPPASTSRSAHRT